MYKEKYPDENNVPRPPHWGGFVVKPKKFEFWQDMPHRIHQRDIFELNNQRNGLDIILILSFIFNIFFPAS